MGNEDIVDCEMKLNKEKIIDGNRQIYGPQKNIQLNLSFNKFFISTEIFCTEKPTKIKIKIKIDAFSCRQLNLSLTYLHI